MKTAQFLSMFAAGMILIGATLSVADDMKMKHEDMGMKKTDHAMATPLKDDGTQKTCPVMGGDIDKNVFVDHDGKRIYFCCSSCKATFKKDPAKYLKVIADNGEKPAQLAPKPQTTCPITNDPIDKKQFVDYNGKRIYVCCGDCKKEVKKHPEKYLKQLEKMGVEPESL